MQGKVFAKGGNSNSNGNENENENRESARFATSLTHCKKKGGWGDFYDAHSKRNPQKSETIKS